MINEVYDKVLVNMTYFHSFNRNLVKYTVSDWKPNSEESDPTVFGKIFKFVDPVDIGLVSEANELVQPCLKVYCVDEVRYYFSGFVEFRRNGTVVACFSDELIQNYYWQINIVMEEF